MDLVRAKLDAEMKESGIKLLIDNAQLKQEEINDQRIWLVFSIGAVCFFAILAAVLMRSDLRRKKANDELSRRNLEIQQQAQQLQYLNQTKDRLFSVISHDLRSPLATLRGLIDIIAIDGLSREDFVSISSKLSRNLESVQGDLDNLLFWAQSQLQGLQIRPISVKLHPIIEEKIRLFGENATQKQITILNEIQPSLSIVADKNHIALVIGNLLANAIKFNKHGGLIKIKERNVNGCIEISVSDTGVGMTVSEVQRLFDVGTHFSRPGTQQEKGLGIGLLLSKEFIERNGGSIWATSEPEKGSTFTFSLKHDDAAVVSEIFD